MRKRGKGGRGRSRRVSALAFLVVMLPLAAMSSADPLAAMLACPALAGQELPESQEPEGLREPAEPQESPEPRESSEPQESQEPRESPEPQAALQQPPPEAQAPPRQLHPEARDAISKIRSPYCPGQMLEGCPSLDARILRDSLDQMAWRGLPADSLVELVVAAYGEEYRALPKRTGTGLLAWVVPPAALIAGLGLVVLALRRLKGPDPGGGRELSDEDRDRIAAALAELEELEGSE